MSAGTNGTLVRDGAALAQDDLSERDRALLTPDVIDRWAGGLAPGDVIDAAEIVKLERSRQRTLQTIRQGIELTDLEFKLLRYLQRNERRTLTYRQIAHHLWGSTMQPVTDAMIRARDGYASAYVRHIWVLISSIRQKLEIDPTRPQHLATMRGCGYRWYAAPPSLDDGEDYERRAVEHERLRAQVRYDFGAEPDDELPPGVRPGAPRLGPSHRDYGVPIEGEVTDRASSRHEADR